MNNICNYEIFPSWTIEILKNIIIFSVFYTLYVCTLYIYRYAVVLSNIGGFFRDKKYEQNWLVFYEHHMANAVLKTGVDLTGLYLSSLWSSSCSNLILNSFPLSLGVPLETLSAYFKIVFLIKNSESRQSTINISEFGVQILEEIGQYKDVWTHQGLENWRGLPTFYIFNPKYKFVL